MFASRVFFFTFSSRFLINSIFPIIAIVSRRNADLRDETELSPQSRQRPIRRGAVIRYYDGNIYYCKHNGGGGGERWRTKAKYFIPFRSIHVISLDISTIRNSRG